MAKQGKRLKEISSNLEEGRVYDPSEAVELAKKGAVAKFDETVELHLKTAADPRHADQQLRGVAVLPHGTGKPVRVAVFAQADAAKSAMDAGADVVGDDDLIDRVEKGFTDFDVAIATPEMMGKIGKLGRVLGRRGLMPNPRTNTVVQQQDVGSAVSEAKKGRVELRMDRTAIIHSSIGKASFQGEHLIDNLAAVIDTINQLKPTGIKGQFVKTAYLTTTMGPGIPLDVNSTMSLTTG
ncbi:MAG: 50S ribosomal protein L1 [Chloroflexi bacterium]|nr:50S ribosomal protein L1 [Chloroflexota bacterium]MBT18279.1 50S ribosomal protein L1 [Dehalococcoidia bacterium]|tara:strand:+ start:607 stop:1320 length:714 start_codon:yes stop_codon:yes gene_type:complete